MLPHGGREVRAQIMSSVGLADSRDIVPLAFHRHECYPPDRRWVDPAVAMDHQGLGQGMAKKDGIDGLQVVLGGEIHDGKKLVIELALFLRRADVTSDHTAKKSAMSGDMTVKV